MDDTGNDITSTSITTTLPSYVSFTNVLSPTSAAVTYDVVSRTVTWRAGDLASGQTATAAFQVSFTPSDSQRGQAPELTGPITFNGFDRYAQVPVSSQANALTTETTGDAGYSGNDADVQ